MQTNIERSFDLGFSLSLKSRSFFKEHVALYDAFNDRLALYRQKDLLLKAHHVDAVIDALEQQRALPADAEAHVEAYLNNCHFDVDQAIQQIRVRELPWLAQQAEDSELSHHTMYHAANMKHETMLGSAQLGIFCGSRRVDEFFKAIFRFAAECHDYIQRKTGAPVSSNHATAELETAALVIQWLLAVLHEVNAPLIVQQSVCLAVNHAIVLATTLILGAEPCDLSELFFLLEQTAIDVGMVVVESSNQRLIHDIHAVGTVISVCDVLAGALPVIINEQFAEPRINLISRLRTHYPSSKLWSFFSGKAFQWYDTEYDAKSDTESLKLEQLLEKNGFIFAVLFVAHLHMRAESGVIWDNIDEVLTFAQYVTSQCAVTLTHFIREHQHLYTRMLANDENDEKNEKAFIKIFNEHFHKYEEDNAVFGAISRIFFSTIDKEVTFCRSLTPLLEANKTKLQAMGYLNEQGISCYELKQVSELTEHAMYLSLPGTKKIQPFIETTVAETDAANLAALGEHFHMLDECVQKQLAKELLLHAIITSGVVYSAHLTKQTFSSSPRIFDTPREVVNTLQSPRQQGSAYGFGGTRYSFNAQSNPVSVKTLSAEDEQVDQDDPACNDVQSRATVH